MIQVQIVKFFHLTLQFLQVGELELYTGLNLKSLCCTYIMKQEQQTVWRTYSNNQFLSLKNLST